MFSKIEVLLIEDDTDDQEVFSMVLQEIDPSIQCSFANNGIEGLERLQRSKSFRPDFIFIDLNMPMMNGFDCLREIKKSAHLENCRTIIYTTSSDEKFLTQSKILGADAFI